MRLVNIHTQIFALLLLTSSVTQARAEVWSLQRCIDTTRYHNKNLQIGKNTVAIGQQRSKETKANLIPKVTAHADYKYYTNLPYQLMPLSTFNPSAPEGQFKEAQFGVPHNFNVNLQLSVPLYNSQLHSAIQQSKIASDLLELQYQKSEEQTFFEIINLYYNAQILNHQIAFLDSNLKNAERLLVNTQLLQQQLLAKEVDVSKITLMVSKINTQKTNTISKYEQILNALKVNMGIPIETIFQIETDIQYQDIQEYIPNSTLDINIAQKQHRLLQSELNTLYKSQLRPAVHLIGMYGTSGFGYDQKPNQFIQFYPIGFAGIQLSYNLFNGTVTQRKIKQKQLESRNSEIQISILTEQNTLQIENAKLQIVMESNSVKTRMEEIEFAKKMYEQTLLQHKQGTASITDILLADNEVREAQQAYLTSVIEYLKADVYLKKISGNMFIKN